tara:strand:+ start:7376 stop:8065 length:690 start_codon:yes stop_codon:yes gene_type:complete
MKNIKIIEDIIKYKFNDTSLLKCALTHTSYKNFKNDSKFERLEFLGDRVLGLVISDMLYEKYSYENEGDLAKRMSVLVSGKTLSKIYKEINFEKYIKVGPNINFENGNNISILSDAMESLIGAIFLDSDYNSVKKFISKKWENYIDNFKNPPKDSKSIIQEWTVSNNYGMPIYSDYEKFGPDHSPDFKVKLTIEKFAKIIGKGNSKKNAEMDAASKVIELINKVNIKYD